MKAYLLISCLFTFSVSIFSQNLKINQAESYFKQFRFADATPIYQELIEKNKISVDSNETIYRHAIISADKSHSYSFEHQVLAKLSLSNKYTFDDAFTYFQVSLYLGFYDKAKEILNSSIVQNSTSDKKSILNSYQQGSIFESFKQDTSLYRIVKTAFNSGSGDFNAIYHPKGIAFTSARDLAFRKSSIDNSSYLNMYIFSKDSSIQELKFLETRKHDGTAYYDSLNKIWYFSKNLPTNKMSKLTTAGLFMYDEKTKVESPFAYNSSQYFYAQPSLSLDGKTLWFSSDREGGFGKSDIWYSKKTEQGWGTPINAGSVVNTSENEMFPFHQNTTLYFSSTGHPGLGGLDIYSVNYVEGNVSELKNLGANLNSNADDFSLILDKTEKKGYFSSNRESFIDNIYSVVITNLDFIFKGTLVTTLGDKLGIPKIPVVIKIDNKTVDTLYADKDGKFEFKGDSETKYSIEIDDQQYVPLKEVYSTIGKTESDTTYKTFELLPRYVDVAVTVFDNVTKEPLAFTNVEVVNKQTGEKMLFTTDKNGNLPIKILRNHEYEIITKHAGYKDQITPLSTFTKEKEIKAPIGMDKVNNLVVGASIPIKNLNFDFDKAILKPESKIELDIIVKLLKENPNMQIEFCSFTDSRGSDDYNMELSKQRTGASIKYITSQGISKKAIVGKWLGETQLLNNCGNGIICSESKHKENRRTEIKILKM